MPKRTNTKTTDVIMDKMFSNGNISIPFKFIKSEKSKYIRIGMSAKGMRVTAPQWLSYREVEEFLKSKSSWILKHYHAFKSLKENKKARSWENGESIMFMGEEHKSKILNYVKKRTTVLFDREGFLIYVNELLKQSERDKSIESALRDWFIDKARDIIGERVEYFTGLTGLKYNSFKIKEQKTLWGSCSRKGNLNFNWKIIMAPQWVYDYVVLHEVCHLKHLNHSKVFWEMVGKYYPDYKKAHEWLRKNKLELM
jgi:hypothetical protein